ncbi:hypothetical protein MOUN0_B03004 [Monosporozyma unispora]|nr:hypothetical protein C6P44_001417 [Kazachstania unispora]
MTVSVGKGRSSDDFELYSIDSLRSEVPSSAINEHENENNMGHVNTIRTMTKNLVKTFTQSSTMEGSDEEDDENELNRILTERFDLGDAIRLETNNIATDDDDDKTNPGDNSTINDLESGHDHDQGKNTILQKVFTNQTTGEIILPPDKGYAWVMVGAVILVMFSSWGCNAAFGVFLSFYLSNNTYPGATKYDYALIAGFPVALGQGMAPFSLILMRVIGIRPTMLLGTAFMLTGFLWASFSTQLWELYVSQGVFVGISISLIANPPTTCIPGWFLKKRAAAMGLVYLGTGLGGLVYGLASNKMLQDDGNANMCYRMLAITCTCSCLIAICLVKERIPTKPTGLKSKKAIFLEFKKFFDGSVIRRPTVLLISMWFNLAIFAYTLMVFTLASYAVARGMSQHQGSILTSLLNTGQTIGRPLMGFMGDRFGRVNVTSFLTCILCIYIFAFWIPAHTFVQLIFFSIMIGLSVGVANVMNGVLIADMVEPHEFLAAWGFVTYSGSPLFLVSELIAQALTVPSKKSNPYLHTQIFTGFCFFGALLLSFFLREKAITIKLQRNQKIVQEKLREREEILVMSESEKSLQKDKVEVETKTEVTDDILTQLIAKNKKYSELLSPGWKNMFKRMTYRTKI